MQKNARTQRKTSFESKINILKKPANKANKEYENEI